MLLYNGKSTITKLVKKTDSAFIITAFKIYYLRYKFNMKISIQINEKRANYSITKSLKKEMN